MAVYNGTSITVYIPTEDTDNDDASTAWEPVALAKSASLNINQDTPDATTKDSAGWAQSIVGVRNWDVSFDGLTDFTLELSADRPNAKALFDYINSRSTIKIAWGLDGYHFYGDTQVTNLSMAADTENPSTFSASLKGTSTLALTSDGSADVDSSATYPQ